MPYYKKKICSFPGCQNNVLGEGRYCETHKKTICRDTTSEFERFYKTSFWKKARKNFLLKHFWCEECMKRGKHTLADTVHHTNGFKDWETFCEISKWEAICASCHGKIHARETNEDLYKKYHGN